MTVRKTVLASGLRIVTEEVAGVRSAAFGIWVNVGSRDEAPSVAGASHFLEHLLFKATKTRSAMDISSAIESVGGEMNAFTGKEYTCFYARVIDTDLPLAIDVISDLITSSLVKAEDVDAERNVVLEEISMRDDDPSDLVIAVAGNLKHKKVVELVEKAISRDGFLSVPKSDYNLRSNTKVKSPKDGNVGILNRKTEQAHLFMGMAGVARDDNRRFTMGVLSAALGGGMSSRLFQEIREKRGLAYSVYSYAQQFAGSGVIGFYAGCNPNKATEVVKIIRDVLHDVADNGLTHEELARAQGAVRGSLVLSQEDTGSRMSRIGKAELVYGENLGFDQILKEVSSVTSAQIRAVASEYLTKSPTLAVVGPYKSGSIFEKAIR